MKDLFKLLLRFVPPYKRYLILNILFNLLSTLLSIFSFMLIIPILEILFKTSEATYTFIPWNEGDLKDIVINNFYWFVAEQIKTNGAIWTLMLLGVWLIVMTFAKTMTAYLSSACIIPLRGGVVRDIRNFVYRKVVSLPIGFFTSERKGDIMSRMTGDVAEVENSIMTSLDMIFKNPIMIISYLTTMFILSWQLTLFVLVLLPLAGFVMGRVGKSLKRKSLDAQQQWGGLMAQIEETLGGLRIIKAFNAENRICQRFAAINDKFYRTTNRIGRRQALAHPMSEFLGTTPDHRHRPVVWRRTYIERKQRHQRRGIHLLPHHLLQHYQSCQRPYQSGLYHTARSRSHGACRQDTLDRKSHKEPREPGKQRRLEPLDRIPGHLVQIQ